MENAKILRYDGSFNGFLCAIYRAFETKIKVIDIQTANESQNGLFTETVTIVTDLDIAQRVWTGIRNKNNGAIKTVYFSFLSEIKGVELLLYKYICSLYRTLSKEELEELHAINVKLYQYTGMVAREKLRIESSAKFGVSKDSVYFSVVEPHYNVIPLISRYYRLKFPQTEFVIYDRKRQLALYNNLEKTQILQRDLSQLHYKGSLPKTNLRSLLNNKLFVQENTPSTTSYIRAKTAV
ncbi:TIGR03915 family putative DNA repair protein [Arenibacter amylolyticus]|uniref:TIGR03915 family putative DNA repair protein n=1 Tax=Arenibacter amylolyticus TaxID=1406873 RepID=UPI000A3A523D|nr:TIGR03915 family putative DNA repair protein [Arenibacter amylolyticus]